MAAAPTRLVVVTRPGDALGFRLAGVAVEEVAPGDEPGRLKAWLADATIGVLAVEERVLAALPDLGLARTADRGPVVLPFALPRSAGDVHHGRDYVAALIQRAIGYHVRLDGAQEKRR